MANSGKRSYSRKSFNEESSASPNDKGTVNTHIEMDYELHRAMKFYLLKEELTIKEFIGELVAREIGFTKKKRD